MGKGKCGYGKGRKERREEERREVYRIRTAVVLSGRLQSDNWLLMLNLDSDDPSCSHNLILIDMEYF